MIDFWNPWPKGNHVAQTMNDVKSQIAELYKLEMTKGKKDGKDCFKIEVYRNATTSDLSAAAGKCDYSFMMFHGTNDKNDPKNPKRWLETGDGLVPTDDISRWADKNMNTCNMYACYVYPDFMGESGAGNAFRKMTEDIKELGVKIPDCCPNVKRICIVLGEDNISRPGMPSYKEDSPPYSDEWNLHL